MSNPLPDLNRINEHGLFGKWLTPMYPIQFAFLEANPAMLKKFIKAGADIHVDIGGGWTLLHRLCATAIDGMIQNDREDFYPHHTEMIKILIENGADLHKKATGGEKPLDVINAYSYESKEDFDIMVSHFLAAIPNVKELVTYQGK